MPLSSQLLLTAIFSCLIALVATPLARRLAWHFGFVDQPARRKFHRRSTPLLGGVALIVAVVSSLAVCLPAGERQRSSFIIGAALVVALAGLWDDRCELSVTAKLLVQLLAALGLLFVGVAVELPLPGWSAGSLTLVWLLGVINAVNLLDNMDGVAVGVAAVAAACFVAIALRQSDVGLAFLAASLGGAAVGFLPFNFAPAKIFMGDTGSFFVGAVLAAIGLELQSGGQAAGGAWTMALAMVLVLIVPIFDTTLVTVSRLRRGRNPLTTPGKDHLAHRLTRLGLSVRATTCLLYSIGAAGGMAAAFSIASGTMVSAAMGAAAAALGMAAIFLLERPALRPTDP